MRLFRLLAAAWLACIAPALAAPTPAASQAFLASHARLAGVTVRPSGLQLRLVKGGIGRHVTPGDAVLINYTARLADGMVIDGSAPGLPAPIDPGATLPGLGEALAAMREGDRWDVVLPPRLAFGTRGAGNGLIPPDQALQFDITIVSSTPAAAAPAPSRDGLSLSAGNGGTSAYWTIHP